MGTGDTAQSFCRSLFPAVTTLRLDVLVQHLLQLRLVRLNLLWRKPLYRVRVYKPLFGFVKKVLW